MLEEPALCAPCVALSYASVGRERAQQVADAIERPASLPDSAATSEPQQRAGAGFACADEREPRRGEVLHRQAERFVHRNPIVACTPRAQMP
jgi:hypothetical protein